MPDDSSRPLKVFLCHAHADRSIVRELYQRLKGEGWIDPWLDVAKILPGQHWTTVIRQSLAEADSVIILVSNNSIDREGFVQREMNYAWDLSLEKPRSVIYLIPLRLEDCEVPFDLRERQWADYFGEGKEETYNALLQSLKLRHEQKLRIEAAERARQEKQKQEREAAEIAAREKAEQEATERARLEAEELARQKSAKKKADQEAAEKAWLEAEDVARQKAAKEKADREATEIVAREKAEQEAAEKARLEAEELERQKAAKEKAKREAAEKAAREKVEQGAAEKTRLKTEELARQKVAKEKAERESVEKPVREKAEKQAAEKTRLETEELARQKATKEKAKREESEETARGKAERRSAQRVAIKKLLPKFVAFLKIVGAIVIIAVLVWVGSWAISKNILPIPTAGKSVTQLSVIKITLTPSPITPTKTIKPSVTLTETQTPSLISTLWPTEITDAKGVKMVLVPAGKFTMGVDSATACKNYSGWLDCEKTYEKNAPLQSISLSDYYIDKYEVTNAKYRDCVTAKECNAPTELKLGNINYYGNEIYNDYPVVWVSRDMAVQYCTWRGNNVHLPTSAEWEKAARGTDKRIYPWGNESDLESKANGPGSKDKFQVTSPIGEFPLGKSPYGAFDMAGNVEEFVQDNVTFYCLSGCTNTIAMTKGGGWFYGDLQTYEFSGSSGAYSSVGFRCARDVNP
jgi:formylglycine-generating enzyme required for sulfatase activity